jgi:hypothetical protein
MSERTESSRTTDWQAAQQIERLFHVAECTVWELRDAEPSPSENSIAIRDGQDALVAYALPIAR